MPDTYVPTKDFSADQALPVPPGGFIDGAGLDSELLAVSQAIDSHNTKLQAITEADNSLAVQSVGAEQLKPGLLEGISDAVVGDVQPLVDSAAASAGAASSASVLAEDARVASEAAAIASQGSANSAAADAGTAVLARDQAQGFAGSADTSSATAVDQANHALEDANRANLCRLRSFDWAEKLDGPVQDDVDGSVSGFSAHWWAVEAQRIVTEGSVNPLTAADIGFVPGGTIVSVNVQDAIEELDSDIQALDVRLDAVETSASNGAAAIIILDSRLDTIEGLLVTMDSRVDAIEAEQIVQNNRLTALELAPPATVFAAFPADYEAGVAGEAVDPAGGNAAYLVKLAGFAAQVVAGAVSFGSATLDGGAYA